MKNEENLMKNEEKEFMRPMTVEILPIDAIKPYEKNPRNNDEAAAKLCDSIRAFGFRVPVLIDDQNVIICGHTRHKAAKMLGMTELPCIHASDMTPAQVRAYRIADNKYGEMSVWDMSLLRGELEALSDMQFDVSCLGFGQDEMEEVLNFEYEVVEPSFDEEEDIDTDRYKNFADQIQYEPTGRNCSLAECADYGKYKELIAEINKIELPAEIAEFLRMAATRHIVFNYRNIAEYYAKAPANIQQLMEQSSLVLVDFDNAVKNGLCQLHDKLEKLRDENEK